ncbi:MAG: AAA family ATPase [Euryarchaeota archaeon]|nr:AAA family ATPase [Euryarchaeota archaeon]
MKIRSLFIDGFGKFHNWKPPVEFGERLTVIVGSNEAGKSTLLHFIRRMIYGFPDRRSRLNHYPPLNGGELGGRLEITGADGQYYTITRDSRVRSKPSIVRNDHDSKTGCTLQELLGPCDKVFYENVCAVGLDELQALSTLQKDEIRDRLAAAGAGNFPIRDVKLRLENFAGNIYTRRGRERKINVLLSELKEVENETRALMDRQMEYDEVNRKIFKENERVKSLGDKQRGINEEISYLKALEQAWEMHRDLVEYRKEFQNIPQIEPFSENAIEDINRIEADLQHHKDECRNSSGVCRHLEEELNHFAIRAEILEQADNIHILERNLEKYRLQLEEANDTNLRISDIQNKLDSTLSSLGKDWDEERVNEFDTSDFARNHVDEIRNRLASISEKVKDQQAELEKSKDKVTERERILSDLRAERENLSHTLSLEVAQKGLRKYYEMQSMIQSMQKSEERLQSILLEEGRAIDVRAAMQPDKSIPSWPSFLIGLSAILILAWGALNSALQIAGIIALILFISIGGILMSRRGATRGGYAYHISQQGVDAKTLSAQRKEIEANYYEVNKDALSLARSLGLDSIPSSDVVEEDIRVLKEKVEKAKEASRIDSRISEANSYCTRANDELSDVKETLNNLHYKYENVYSEWECWLRDRNLPRTIAPDQIPDLFARIERAVDLSRQIRIMNEKIEGLFKATRSFEEEIDHIIDACSESLTGPYDVKAEKLISIYGEEKKRKKEYDVLHNQLISHKSKLKESSDKLNALTKNLDIILKDREVESIEEYREYEKLWRKKKDLEESIRKEESSIMRISGEERYLDFLEALQVYDPIKSQLRLEEKKNKLKEINEAINESHREIGNLESRQSGIESDDKLSHLLSREITLRDEIAYSARQWAVYTAALSLLNSSIEIFERERQPKILQEAQYFFTQITGEKYGKIIRPYDGSDIYVEEVMGAQRKVDELSRGTAEQLYLALRFGYIKDYVNSHTPVPIIFDDILVNFDPERRKNACRAIAELTKACQVIYFTCHPNTVEDFNESIPDTVVINLSEG